MSTSLIGEFDVVKLKDGREGTIVEIYRVPGLPLAYEIEFNGRDLETIYPDVIEKVIWKPGDQTK